MTDHTPDRAALRDRIADALLTTPRTDYDSTPNHRNHRYDARCALCAYDVDALADAVLAVLPPVSRADVLTAAERAMLTYALDQAQERIWSEDGFTDEDQAAVDSLRRMADEEQQQKPERSDVGTEFVRQADQPDEAGLAAFETDLVGLVRDFLDPDPCQLDHHGYCQAHFWMCSDSRCPHARAREVLAAIDDDAPAVVAEQPAAADTDEER